MLTVLYAFSQIVANKNAEGGNPWGLTWGSDGNLFCANYIGGTNADGSVCLVEIATLDIQVLAGRAVLTWTNSGFSLESAAAAGGTVFECVKCHRPIHQYEFRKSGIFPTHKQLKRSAAGSLTSSDAMAN